MKIRPDDANRFQQMSERIEHNKDAEFGGAVVIVPPENGGSPVELLILDSSGDPAQFWSLIQVKAKMILEEIDARARLHQGFGNR